MDGGFAFGVFEGHSILLWLFFACTFIYFMSAYPKTLPICSFVCNFGKTLSICFKNEKYNMLVCIDIILSWLSLVYSFLKSLKNDILPEFFYLLCYGCIAGRLLSEADMCFGFLRCLKSKNLVSSPNTMQNVQDCSRRLMNLIKCCKVVQVMKILIRSIVLCKTLMRDVSPQRRSDK